MKYFPIRTVIACLLVTPVLYSVTLILGESYFVGRYESRIRNIMIGDSRPLLEGSVSLEKQIAANIRSFLSDDWIIRLTGLELVVWVTTSQGKILYPLYMDALSSSLEAEFTEEPDPLALAKKNYEYLSAGFQVQAEAKLTHGSFISNLILGLYLVLSVIIFIGFYRAGKTRADRDLQQNMKLIEDLKEEESSYKKILEDLKTERKNLFVDIRALNDRYEADRQKAKVNEEEMFQEIVSLEEKINTFIELKKRREAEIEDLKGEIQKGERRKTSRVRRNEFEFVLKRFSALYKSVEMNRRAVADFVSLKEEQQIKVEELIHLMDSDPDKIIVKRKVFSGKKNRTPCFEVLFSYSGRLYFKRNESSKMEILALGTKNSQTRDMEFIHNL